MGIKAAPEVKYKLIREAMQQSKKALQVSKLCFLAGVSRAGYYKWLKAEPRRMLREKADERDFALIQTAYQYRGYPKGGRQIYMWFFHQNPPIVMNLKKIYRLMQKYGLFCPVRRANPYRQLAKALRTSYVAQNVIMRNFKAYEARQALLTDITYLFFTGGNCYLSTIIDVATHEVLAYRLSRNLKVEFVIETVEMLTKKHSFVLDDGVIVHSDQGCHYTSKAFIEKLKDEQFVQSMSRKGNCWDNAPQESFFGHMKDEIATIIKSCKTYEEVEKILKDWMEYYNNERYQWDLLKLSPKEYYEYRLSGIYPIQDRRKYSKGYKENLDDNDSME